MKFIKWEDDKWLSKQGSILPWDKLEHFLLAFGLILILIIYVDPTPSGWPSVLFVSLLAVGWEIRDGFFSGFSGKDLIAGFVGLGAGYLIV